jgi:hypothetical protein
MRKLVQHDVVAVSGIGGASQHVGPRKDDGPPVP